MSGEWCTIESDPGVFSELLDSLGVKNVQVEELISLEADSFEHIKPVYGLIFLFKWQAEEDRRAIAHGADVFFARQVVQNACATQAILSILLNRSDIDVGGELSQFKEFTRDLDPEMRGMAIGSSDTIRKVHNSFARPEPFVFEEKKKDDEEGEDAFHFIGYVPVGKQLFELDGLKAGPIQLAEIQENVADSWLTAASQAIQERITRYTAKEIRFNLLAIVGAKVPQYEEQLTALRSEYTDATGSMVDEVKAAAPTLSAQIAEVERLLSDEKDKRARWHTENIRRKHNYVPFAFQLLKALAEKGKLNELTENGKKTATERAKRVKEQKEKRKKEKEEEKASKDKGKAAEKK